MQRPGYRFGWDGPLCEPGEFLANVGQPWRFLGEGIMTRICRWLANAIARILEPEERDVVLGDFAECGEPAGQALRYLVVIATL